MRVLALSPGSLQQQLERLPALAATAEQLQASLQVACDPSHLGLWKLLPAVEKVIPFPFNSAPTLADWANLLGLVREPDFQACLNFATGRQVNLMLSMSHIPGDWPQERWTALPDTIRSKLPQLRSQLLAPGMPVTERAAAVACADVVLSSCPITQLLATYCGLPMVALGTSADQLPQREVIRRLESSDLSSLSDADVMQALGF